MCGKCDGILAYATAHLLVLQRCGQSSAHVRVHVNLVVGRGSLRHVQIEGQHIVRSISRCVGSQIAHHLENTSNGVSTRRHNYAHVNPRPSDPPHTSMGKSLAHSSFHVTRRTAHARECMRSNLLRKCRRRPRKIRMTHRPSLELRIIHLFI